jgi:hypothetical protein
MDIRREENSVVPDANVVLFYVTRMKDAKQRRNQYINERKFFKSDVNTLLFHVMKEKERKQEKWIHKGKKCCVRCECSTGIALCYNARQK